LAHDQAVHAYLGSVVDDVNSIVIKCTRGRTADPTAIECEHGSTTRILERDIRLIREAVVLGVSDPHEAATKMRAATEIRGDSVAPKMYDKDRSGLPWEKRLDGQDVAAPKAGHVDGEHSWPTLRSIAIPQCCDRTDRHE